MPNRVEPSERVYRSSPLHSDVGLTDGRYFIGLAGILLLI